MYGLLAYVTAGLAILLFPMIGRSLGGDGLAVVGGILAVILAIAVIGTYEMEKDRQRDAERQREIEDLRRSRQEAAEAQVERAMQRYLQRHPEIEL